MTDRLSDAERFSRDAQLISEVAAQREHELTLAKLQYDKELRLAQEQAGVAKEELRYRSNARENRRPYVLGGIGLICLCIAVLGIVYGVNHDGDQKRRMDILRNKDTQVTIQKCISEGNIWTSDGACLLAQKPITK